VPDCIRWLDRLEAGSREFVRAQIRKALPRLTDR
jgi:hypothetical protein